MRAVVVLISLLFAAAGARAQTPAPEGPRDVQIVKYSWSKERIGWEGDPFGGTEGFGNDVRSRVTRERPLRSVLQERDQREVREAKERPPAPPRYGFNYKLSVHNAGQKTIKEIDWDYVFRDAATGEELGRREFTSVEKVSPGQRKELSVFVSSPPTRKISVYMLGKKERAGLDEHVIVVRILYDDATTWEAR